MGHRVRIGQKCLCGHAPRILFRNPFKPNLYLPDPCATVRWGLTANVQKAPKTFHRFLPSENYPNPFNPETTIKYHLNVSAEIRLQVFDMRGQLISTLHSGMQSTGTHSVIWNSTDDSGHNMASGLYLIRLQSGGHCRQIKAVLLR